MALNVEVILNDNVESIWDESVLTVCGYLICCDLSSRDLICGDLVVT
jgi:hypothetical protein